MTAWSGDPIPENLVRNSTPLQLQGAAIFQSKDCRNCHALQGSGGRRGPDLTTVGTRLTRDQLIVQVSNGTPGGIKQGDPGGGNMPAFGKQVSPAEMTALVAFLESLRPPGEPPAEPASVRTGEKHHP
jgi:ubiquinol-cytochrome c reductase cytochrome b subunit